jgi:hypothetical protein
MKARHGGAILCRCGFVMSCNLNNELMCVNPKCGGYEIRYELPKVELKLVEKGD